MTRFEAELDKKLTLLENQIEWHEERLKQIEAEMRRAYRLPQIKAELERDLAELQRQYRELWQVWKERVSEAKSA